MLYFFIPSFLFLFFISYINGDFPNYYSIKMLFNKTIFRILFVLFVIMGLTVAKGGGGGGRGGGGGKRGGGGGGGKPSKGGSKPKSSPKPAGAPVDPKKKKGKNSLVYYF